MKKLMISLSALILVFTLSACSGQNKLDGIYIATELPSTEETVVEKVTIKGNELTMSGKNLSKTLEFKIQGKQIVFDTKFGTFSYAINVEDGIIIIDGITYIKQGE